MAVFFGVLGFLIAFISLIWLIFRALFRKGVKFQTYSMLVGIVLFFVGVFSPLSSSGNGNDVQSASGAPSSTSSSTTTAASTSAPATQPAAAPAPSKEEPKNNPTITKAEFDQIQIGMTLEQVTQIIGSEGEVMTEAGDGEYKMVMRSWKGERGFGANSTMTFTNDKVEAKAQIGLK